MPPTSTLNAPLLKIIKVASIAAYLDDGPQLSSRMRQRIDDLMSQARLTMTLNGLTVNDHVPTPPAHAPGTLVATNRFSLSTSLHLVIATGTQDRRASRQPARTVYAVMRLVHPFYVGPDIQAVNEDGVIHCVLGSAALTLPAWDVGQWVEVTGAGVRLQVKVKGRWWRDRWQDRDGREGGGEWEYVLFRGGWWLGERQIAETFESVERVDDDGGPERENGEEGKVEESKVEQDKIDGKGVMESAKEANEAEAQGTADTKESR